MSIFFAYITLVLCVIYSFLLSDFVKVKMFLHPTCKVTSIISIFFFLIFVNSKSSKCKLAVGLANAPNLLENIL